MRVLLTGATGFIGRHIAARLLRHGHELTVAVRDAERAARRFPGVRTAAIDMNRMTRAQDWGPLLAGIDAVVNCAGILQSGRGQSAMAVHAEAPKALFDGCVAVNVRRVVQISAVSADAAAGTEFALSKKAADDYLRHLDLDWMILRPSLVYAQGSFGGTSVLRGLAGLPFVMPLIGDGGQRFQPIHADDLAETVRRCIEGVAGARWVLDPVGPETLTLKDMLALHRAWLDLPPARFVAVPRFAARLAARLGDLTGAGPMRTTALRQMEYGNVSDPAAFEKAIGFRPKSMGEAFAAAPSHVQDRWHARLYFLRPALTLTLAMLWIGSGLAGLFNPPHDVAATFARLTIPETLSGSLIVGLSLVDIAIGLALIAAIRPRLMGTVQLALIGAYTLALTLAAPGLWADPYGALLKNLPILAAVAVWTALQDDK